MVFVIILTTGRYYMYRYRMWFDIARKARLYGGNDYTTICNKVVYISGANLSATYESTSLRTNAVIHQIKTPTVLKGRTIYWILLCINYNLISQICYKGKVRDRLGLGKEFIWKMFLSELEGLMRCTFLINNEKAKQNGQ